MPFEPPPKVLTDADYIRIGCSITPTQGFGRLFHVDDKGRLTSCAAGAWLLGKGLPVSKAREYSENPSKISLYDLGVAYPGIIEVFNSVWRLNDSGYTREQIAALLEEADER